MSEDFYSIVTDYGSQKQLNSIKNGTPFDVQEIALGDSGGSYYNPSPSQTALRKEVWRGIIQKCEWDGNRFYCLTTVPAEVGGFVVREAGIYDCDGNLLVISKFPETTKQDPSSGTVKELTIRIEIQLSNIELAELIINPDIQTATKDELANLSEKINSEFQAVVEKGQPNGYAPVDNNGLIPIEFIPEIKTKSILTPFCLNSCKLDSKGNPDLLSCETVKVVKYTSSTLGEFYVAPDFVFEKDAVVYADTELTEEKGTIVAVDTNTLSIAFGEIGLLSEFDDITGHYSNSVTGEFYVQDTLALGIECFADAEFSERIGVVTYLNLTKICISENETYSLNGNVTTHIYITAHAPFTYTTADSTTHNVENNLVLDAINLCPESADETKDFNLFVNNDNDEYSLIALSNNIFTQMLEPTNYSVNDIWFRIIEPLASYIFLLNIWQETNLVPIGVFTLEGGEK